MQVIQFVRSIHAIHDDSGAVSVITILRHLGLGYSLFVGARSAASQVERLVIQISIQICWRSEATRTR